MDYDVVQTVNQRIILAQSLDLDKLPTTDEERKILKLGWLINDIKINGVTNPIQLIKSGTKYFCHPGSDKILVTSYICPRDIEGIYLWYKEIDNSPFLLDYQHKKITNFLQFSNLFHKSSSFKFCSTKINTELDTSDRDIATSNAVFDTAKTCFLKTTNDFDFDFITYSDKIQWSSTKDMKLKNIIQFVTDTECLYGGVTFLKKNNYWIPVND